jgi:hypothetical protein
MLETISDTFGGAWPVLLALFIAAAVVLSPGGRAGVRTAMRVLAYPLLLLAAVALITDVTRTASGDAGLVVTSLAEHWRAIAPATFDAARAAVTRRVGTWMWDPMIFSVLRLPGWLALGGLGLALSYAGRRRRTVNVFAN